MSRIFRAFEKAWESRHARPLVEPGTDGTEIYSARRSGSPRNGSSHAAVACSVAEHPLPSLASLVTSARIRLASGAPILPFDGSDPRAAEQYKIIRTKILHHPIKPSCVVVTSAQTDDGKSVSAINIAGCMALKDQTTVLLVDADMRRSSMAATLGVPDSPGLADMLTGQVPLEKAIVRLDPFQNFYFLSRGERQSSPAELLDSSRWRATISLLRREFGFVVVDAPPIGLVADFELVERAADGVILVIRPDHTNRTLGLKALELVQPEKLLGVVLNCAADWFVTKPLSHRYYHYYDEKP